MNRFYPTIYKKDIFAINYDKLKGNGITTLIFDLDNTICLIDQEYVDLRTKTLFTELNDNFKLIIISNNSNKKRVEKYANILKCDYVYFAMKPLLKGYRKIKKKYKLKNKEMCMIGDQLVTDIFSGNRFNITTILVDPLSFKDLKITKINRIIEKRILKKLEKDNLLRKGEYYE